MQAIDSGIDRRAVTAVALCLLVAILEGIDIQSMGVSMPRLAAEFQLNPVQVGRSLSASLVGLLIGAAIGGRASDWIGRKVVLIVSVFFLGLFSLATTRAPDFNSLLVIRLLTGLGMGGAFPMLIAIVAESVPQRVRSTSISLMYCGMPIGGALAAAIATTMASSHGWRTVFYLGGIGPLLVMPALALLLPGYKRAATLDSRSLQATKTTTSMTTALFGEGRLLTTWLLWTSYFFTLLMVYLLLNWLPSLMVANGFSRTQATSLSLILNVGAAIGSVALGTILDHLSRRSVVLGTYAAMLVSLVALAFSHSYSMVTIAAFVAGFFTIGGQLLLYALAPSYYPAAVRGTGIGAAVAIGRFGAICGPLLAGQLMGSGSSAASVLIFSIPCVMLGAVAVFALLFRPTAD